MKTFSGPALFLDRSDINTDEIIPARYLTENSKEALRPYLLEDLNLDGFTAQKDLPGKRVIITRANFGCGSSREHAAWALEVNDIHLVIAESFARIFRQNMFNCGLMAVALPAPTIDDLFEQCSDKPATVETDMSENRFRIQTDDSEMLIPFSIADFDRALVDSGGWVEYADANY